MKFFHYCILELDESKDHYLSGEAIKKALSSLKPRSEEAKLAHDKLILFLNFMNPYICKVVPTGMGKEFRICPYLMTEVLFNKLKD